MKLCWDNVDNFKININGNIRFRRKDKSRTIFVLKEACKLCGSPYMSPKRRVSDFCGHSCVCAYHLTGITRSQETKDKVSIGNTGKRRTKEVKDRLSAISKKRVGPFSANYGKVFSEEYKHKISESLKGKPKPSSVRLGADNYNYKNNVSALNVCPYDTYVDRLDSYNKIRKQELSGFLEVSCIYCNTYFLPSRSQVINRISALNSAAGNVEQNFYCSDGCRKACPVYRKQKYPEGYSPRLHNEVQPELRKLVLSRDNYICQKCGANKFLNCHHIDPTSQNPIESADMDNCITFCKECHKEAHKIPGCSYSELKCKE